jgi:hypothetical protein
MIFDEIARSNFWGGANETISGRGSTTYSTLALRNCLGDWIIKYNIKTIVDVPCGDANWQYAIPGIEKVTYTGYDVSQHAIIPLALQVLPVFYLITFAYCQSNC